MGDFATTIGQLSDLNAAIRGSAGRLRRGLATIIITKENSGLGRRAGVIGPLKGFKVFG